MKNPFIIGDKIYLRGIEREDLPEFVRWINDSEVTHYMYTGLQPANLELLTEEWQQETRSFNDVVMALCDKEKDILVGKVGLYSINRVSLAVEYRIFIGDKTYWNKGYGTEAAQLILDYAFMKLNLNKVWLGVNAEDKRATRSYEKSGFTKEGILRQEVYRNGKYYDAVRMSILREEFFNKKNNE